MLHSQHRLLAGCRGVYEVSRLQLCHCLSLGMGRSLALPEPRPGLVQPVLLAHCSSFVLVSFVLDRAGTWVLGSLSLPWRHDEHAHLAFIIAFTLSLWL